MLTRRLKKLVESGLLEKDHTVITLKYLNITLLKWGKIFTLLN
ncbi:hypothetical protein ALT1000_200038 [Alteromonas macleodii]